MEGGILKGPEVSKETRRNMQLSFSQYLANVTQKYHSKTTMIEANTEEKLTAAEIFRRSNILSSFLHQLGYGPGTVIAIVSENRIDYPIILLATLHIGATVTCVNPLYSIGELKHSFFISRPSVVFASSMTFKKLEKLCDTCYLMNMDQLQFSELFQLDTIIKSVPIAPVNSEQTALILYSSGTTGLSKGVKLTHRSLNFLMECYRTEKVLRFSENNVVSGVLPMCHCYGLFSILSCIVLGHTYVLIKRYTETSFLTFIQKYKINTLYLVPSIMQFLAQDPLINNYDLSSVECISSGGGAMKKTAVESVLKRLKRCCVLQNYGMTETTTMCLASLPNSKVGTTGRLMPGMMAKIVDVNKGTTLGPLEEGELCVKGPLLMKGYCQNETETLNAIDSAGWLHTGDIAYYDAHGDFYVTDRIKEIIKYKGFQVPPSELENLLIQHPDILAAGVVGVPDECAGELPRAYVVARPDSTISEDDVKQFVADNISPQKKLRGGVVFVDQIPKTVTEKICRKELRKWVKSSI